MDDWCILIIIILLIFLSLLLVNLSITWDYTTFIKFYILLWVQSPITSIWHCWVLTLLLIGGVFKSTGRFSINRSPMNWSLHIGLCVWIVYWIHITMSLRYICLIWSYKLLELVPHICSIVIRFNCFLACGCPIITNLIHDQISILLSSITLLLPKLPTVPIQFAHEGNLWSLLPIEHTGPTLVFNLRGSVWVET